MKYHVYTYTKGGAAGSALIRDDEMARAGTNPKDVEAIQEWFLAQEVTETEYHGSVEIDGLAENMLGGVMVED